MTDIVIMQGSVSIGGSNGHEREGSLLEFDRRVPTQYHTLIQYMEYHEDILYNVLLIH